MRRLCAGMMQRRDLNADRTSASATVSARAWTASRKVVTNQLHVLPSSSTPARVSSSGLMTTRNSTSVSNVRIHGSANAGILDGSGKSTIWCLVSGVAYRASSASSSSPGYAAAVPANVFHPQWGGASMIQVIPTTGVFQYEPFGFTNCTRYRDVLYLSGISAVDEQGRIVATTSRRRPLKLTRTSKRCCGRRDLGWIRFSR